MMPNSSPSGRATKCLAVTALLLLAAAASIPLDLTISRSINLESLPGDLRRVLALSEFFAHGFGVIVVLVTLATLAPNLRRTIPRLATCALLPGLVVQLVKLSVGRYRPGVAPRELSGIGDAWVGWFPSLNSGPVSDLGYAIESFPSGHTATAFGLAVGLGWLFPRGRVLFLLFACLGATQRIVFHAHWMSDVLVGCAIGVLVAHWLTIDHRFPGRWFASFERRTELAGPSSSRARRPAA